MEVYIQQTREASIITALLLILVGILFIIDQTLAVSVGILLIGAFMIVAGLMPLLTTKQFDITSIIMIILGIVVIMARFLLADILLLVIGVIAILVGVMKMYGALTGDAKNKLMDMAVGLLIALAGFAIAVQFDFAFVLFGALLVLAGVVNLIDALKK